MCGRSPVLGTLNSLAPDGKGAVKFDSHVMVVPAGVDEAGQAKAKTLMAWLAKNGAAWANSVRFLPSFPSSNLSM